MLRTCQILWLCVFQWWQHGKQTETNSLMLALGHWASFINRLGWLIPFIPANSVPVAASFSFLPEILSLHQLFCHFLCVCHWVSIFFAPLTSFSFNFVNSYCVTPQHTHLSKKKVLLGVSLCRRKWNCEARDGGKFSAYLLSTWLCGFSLFFDGRVDSPYMNSTHIYLWESFATQKMSSTQNKPCSIFFFFKKHSVLCFSVAKSKFKIQLYRRLDRPQLWLSFVVLVLYY